MPNVASNDFCREGKQDEELTVSLGIVRIFTSHLSFPKCNFYYKRLILISCSVIRKIKEVWVRKAVKFILNIYILKIIIKQQINGRL